MYHVSPGAGGRGRSHPGRALREQSIDGGRHRPGTGDRHYHREREGDGTEEKNGKKCFRIFFFIPELQFRWF